MLHDTAPRIEFTDEQVDWLIENVPGAASWSQITAEFNKVFNQNKKSTALKSKIRSISGLYINEGRKGHHIGTPSYTSLPIGSERILKSGYAYVKTNTDTWEPKQKVIYEAEYGPIPEGSFVIFLNKDPTDFRLENLYLVDRSLHAHMSRGGWYSTDSDQTFAGLKYWELVMQLRRGNQCTI